MAEGIRKSIRGGEHWIWVTGAALAVCLLLLAGLILLILVNGLGHFWPHPIAELRLHDGRTMIGEIQIRELTNQARQGGDYGYRIKLKRGNRDLFNQDFIWLDESELQELSYPADLMVVERDEYGNFYGRLQAIQDGSVQKPHPSATDLKQALDYSRQLGQRIRKIQKGEIAQLNYQLDQLRLSRRRDELAGRLTPERQQEHEAIRAELLDEIGSQENALDDLRTGLSKQLIFKAADGTSHAVSAERVLRIGQPNSMSLGQKLWWYFTKLFEFIFGEPREANTEGGVFPALFGTVLMVLLMSIVVTPLGVLAAVYLKEYARQGPLVSLIRIGVNNLAGVPSIVFGVFGLGFFIYFIGGSIDQLFYPEALPAPTFGTGGILWSALTLALLTVPTVIVATEEGLAAMPVNWREGAYALGATKFETLRRIILPALTPAILTGVILAIARAAGEVAPLMITGVVKHAPTLPWDANFPFLHLDRKFMHLGFHIYDLGFQSPNVDATRPLVYSTTLLLIVIVIALNAVAIYARNHIRKKLLSGAM